MSSDTSTGVSIIVPLLNEEAVAEKLMNQLEQSGAEQIIIVDGGSSDSTRELVRAAGYTVVESAAGRAKQMNAGAKLANQRMLLFLHADTKLPKHYKSEIVKADVWGRFDVSFDDQSRSMNMVAYFMNFRSRISSVATGDQAIFVDRDVFQSVGGFPEFPLMEDVAICKRLRQLHRPFNSREKVVTSARRWEQHGVGNTILKMWWYRLAFFLGVSPSKLRRGYEDVR